MKPPWTWAGATTASWSLVRMVWAQAVEVQIQ